MCPYFTIFYKSLTDETNKVQLVFGQIESGLLKNNPVLYSGNCNKKRQKSVILNFVSSKQTESEERRT